MERDDLRSQLNSLETRAHEIQNNVRLITQDRDRINKLYNDARNELKRYQDGHRDCSPSASLHHAHHHIPCSASQAVVRRAESDRDRVMSELNRISSEPCDEKADVRQELEVCKISRDELGCQLDRTKMDLTEMDKQRQTLSERCDEVHRNAIQKREECVSLENQLQAARDEISKLQNELLGVNEERSELMKANRSLDKQLTSLAADKSRLARELHELGHDHKSLHDQCVKTKAEAADLLSKYQVEAATNEKMRTRLETAEHRAESGEHRAGWAEDKLRSAEANAGSLQSKIAAMQENIDWLQSSKVSLHEENKKLRVCFYSFNKRGIKLLYHYIFSPLKIEM
ncbi:hypothetical protein Ciccas_004390 [Cichlidogyrus casuarinus]|uniref:Uncharacterized protein n=1 Tax=Cichlidogyrus casuarinus TaxID=1844966 RepID=A0ABD2QBR6_9PLAT